MDKELIKHLINKKRDIIIFEIGAADGRDSAAFLHTFADCDFKLYCFEPDSRNIKSFKGLIGNDPRVSFIEKAIGDHSQNNVEWHKSGRTESGHEHIYSSSLREPYKCYETWPELVFEKTTIDMISLDEFVEKEGITHVDFIWMDVQGAEDLVIKGAAKTLETKVKFLFTEYGDTEYYHDQPTLKTIRGLLPNFEIIADFKTDVLFMNPKLYRQ